MKKVILFILSLIWSGTGCAIGSFEPLPGQNEAAAIVWNQLYGETGAAPAVEWLDKDAPFGGCALAGWKVQVMRNDVTVAENGSPFITRYFSETSYAHEFLHIHVFNQTGDIDAFHWRIDWGQEEKAAKRALRNAGL